MSEKVVHLADVLNDNRLIDIPTMLRQCADDMENGNLSPRPNKAVVLLLHDLEDMYVTRIYASNMASSEMVALCEVHKAKFLKPLLGDE